MFARLLDLLRRPSVGPIASLLALVLAVLLGASLVSANRTEAEMNARVVKLANQLNDSGSYWRARALACETVGARGEGVRKARAGESTADAAKRLAGEPPAGFDVCARMESADAAVLSTLK